MRILFNLGNSVSLFFLVLFVASVIIVFSFDKDESFSYSARNEIPMIELNDFTAYRINDMHLFMKMNAREAKRFEEFEEFYDVQLEQKRSSVKDTLTSPHAIRQGDLVFFNEGVSDIHNGYNLYSSKAVYDMANNIFQGQSEFKISSEFEHVVGDDVYYDMKNGLTNAKNIHAILVLQKKNKK